MRHVENLAIVRTVYSNIFKHIEGHLGIFSHVRAYWGTLKHIETFRHYWGILNHIQTFRTLCNPWIHNHVIFRTQAHLGFKVSSKTWQTCKMMGNIQSYGIVRTVFSRIFKDIFKGYSRDLFSRDVDAYSATLTGMQLWGRWKVLPF